jgi:chromate transport protein ChrA
MYILIVLVLLSMILTMVASKSMPKSVTILRFLCIPLLVFNKGFEKVLVIYVNFLDLFELNLFDYLIAFFGFEFIDISLIIKKKKFDFSLDHSVYL